MRDDDELLRRYLLGELETEEEDRLEARLIQDPELFEQAEAVEADLLADYAHGLLSTSQRSRIQRHLATSSATRSQLAMVRGIEKVAEKETPKHRVLTGPWIKELSSPWFRTLAAAMLAIAVLSGWFDHRTTRLQNEIEVMASFRLERPIRQEQQTFQPEDRIVHKAPTPVPVPSPPPPPVVVQLFQLALSAHRGPGGVEELLVKPETARVDFQFPLLPGDETYASYQVVIKDAATGEELIRRDGLRPVKAGAETVLRLPVEPKQLRPGSYEAAVKGIPAEGEAVDLGFPQFQVADPEMNPQG